MNDGAIGLVLAGGASRRLGQDKAILPYRGGHLSGWAAERLAEVCEEVLVADGGRNLVAGLESVLDGPGKGPAAGLLGGALARRGSRLLVLACDLPRVPVGFLKDLLAADSGQAAVPRHEGGLEPLCALYHPTALSLLEERVAAGSFGLQAWLSSPELEISYLEGENLRRHGVPSEVFFNLNRPEDLRLLGS